MADGALSFFSWIRRGLAAAVETDPVARVTQVVARIQFNADEDLVATPAIPLIGPGDIVGLDSDVVVRTWPKADEQDAEFVSYALIEFDQADLAWRYSPEPAGDRVRPWFSLLVLASDECSLEPATPERPIAALRVKSVGDLPSSDDLWAWSHTQIAGIEPDVAGAIVGQPGLFTGRLMSPRLLRPNQEYVACLVPTFERGRLVGLGRLKPDSSNPDENPPVRDTWNRTFTESDGSFLLPVYHSWSFRTGSVGNFEHAARLIRPFVLPATMGRRDMDASDPGMDLEPAATGSLPVEGALMSVAAFEAEPPVWPEPERQPFIDDLRELLNIPANGGEPELVPPLYGQWYAADDGLDEPRPSGSNPVWFFELNSDPRNRVAAALGTQVIQNEQQALLASGWDQVGEIRSINDKARVLQLSRRLLARIWERHFLTASTQRFYHLTYRLHAYVTCGDETVCGNVRSSPILPGFLSAQWLRWTRPRGPIGLLQGRPALGSSFVPNLLQQLNACKRPATDPGPPPGRHDPRDPRGGLYCESIEVLIGLGSSVTLFWGLLLLWVVRKLLVSQSGDCWWIALKALRFAIILIRISIDPEDVRRRCRLAVQGITPQDILNAPKLSGFAWPALRVPVSIPFPPTPVGTIDSPDAAAVRDALHRMLLAMQLPARLLCQPGMDIETCKLALETQLSPVLTVGRIFLENRQLTFDWDPKDELEPLFAPPEYERPMYEPLSRVSFDWILPGLSEMKRDTVGLAVTNQRFIEAYMVGLNHEMTRELLWNEFPTDQRGTYFRQFWDIAGHILSDGSKYPPEQLRDILPIRLWSKNAALGENNPRPRPNGDDDAEFLVLVIRAQLIQKYPNVIVYAQRRSSDGHLTGEQIHPVFYALLKPDIAFYGFEMTADDVRADPSLYFVLQEQPGEPKFADEDTNRAANKYTTSPESFGATAGVFAQETFLQPFRLGIQGTTLLPEPPNP